LVIAKGASPPHSPPVSAGLLAEQDGYGDEKQVLCKFLCHNICCLISAIYELGLSPVFGTDVATA
jgi:hypothetical protein